MRVGYSCCYSVVILLCFLSFIVNCHWNLLMNEAETKKLLGIPGELFYIKNGVINDYALAFNIPIKSDVEEMHFDWYNVRTDFSIPPIAYSITVHLSNTLALLQPYLNIPNQGVVPTKRSTFSVLMRCSGGITADVDIKLQFDFTVGSPNNITKLEVRRKKLCVRDVVKHKNKGIEFKTTEGNQLFNQIDSKTNNDPDHGDKSIFSKKYFYLVVGCGVGAVVVIFLIFLCCFCRNSRRNTGLSNGSCPSRAVLPVASKCQDNQNYCTYTPTCESIASGSSSNQHTLPFPSQKPNYQEALYLLNEIALNRHLISFGEVITRGLHGSIYHGYVSMKSPDGENVTRQPVIIKTFLDESSFDPVSSAMLTDACLLRGLSHANLSPCIGSCLDHFPMMVLYEDGGFDNLKMFLTRLRNVEVLSPQQLTYIALQITRGLAFLHSKKILHKDVATRNCFITTNLQSRLGDGFLSNDIFPDDYFCSHDGDYLPIRWMAIESIADCTYTPSSDIWSLGILMWELFSLAEQPYETNGAGDLAHHLVRGFRLQQPRTCPNELFVMMSRCWLVSPGDRPRMNHLLTFLVNFYNTLSRYV